MLIHKFNAQLKRESERGIIKPIDAINLMVNVIAVCIFPILAKPIIMGVMFENNKKQYKEFLKQRKEHVTQFLIDAIKAN